MLGDAADAPHYLATVGRQGYRFLVGDDREVAPRCWPAPRGTPGRSRQLAVVVPAGGPRHPPGRVCQWRSRDGQDDAGGAVAAGPPGHQEGVRIARGQCVEHFEGVPATLGWGNSAVGRVTGRCWTHCSGMRRCGSSNGRGCCPKRSCSASNASSRATSARMLRELAEVLDVLTAETPLVLFLEDLHWSDRSTVECLNYVAQRRVPRGCWCWGPIARWRPQASPAAHRARAVWAGVRGGHAPGVAHQRGCDGLYDRAPGGSGVRPTRGRRL